MEWPLATGGSVVGVISRLHSLTRRPAGFPLVDHCGPRAVHRLTIAGTIRTAVRAELLHEHVEVRTSSIEGLGLFAGRPFYAGQHIRQINVVREVTPTSPLRQELGERANHCDYPDGKVVLLGFPDRHINHSCDPNAYVLYEGDLSLLVARRDIAAGEEITCDYNINITGGTAWPCHCGTARCSGTVLGDFFRLPLNVQREYQPLLAEWFVLAHRDRLRALGLA